MPAGSLELAAFVAIILSSILALIFRPRPANEANEPKINTGMPYKKLIMISTAMLLLGIVGMTIASIWDRHILMKASKGTSAFGALLLIYGLIKRAVLKYDDLA